MSETRPPYITSEESPEEAVSPLPELTLLVLPEAFRDLLRERRRAALTEAQAIGRMLGLPDVCPRCGKKH